MEEREQERARSFRVWDGWPCSNSLPFRPFLHTFQIAPLFLSSS
jgi:hypothetical protein